MIPSLEPLLCPCCTPALLHALSQYSLQMLSQPFSLLGTGALSAAVGLNNNPQPSAVSTDRSQDSVRMISRRNVK